MLFFMFKFSCWNNFALWYLKWKSNFLLLKDYYWLFFHSKEERKKIYSILKYFRGNISALFSSDSDWRDSPACITLSWQFLFSLKVQWTILAMVHNKSRSVRTKSTLSWVHSCTTLHTKGNWLTKKHIQDKTKFSFFLHFLFLSSLL